MTESIKSRYDKCVENRLKNEYEWLLAYCHKKGIAILSLSLDSFVKRAKECSYVLGMRPKIENDCDSVYDEKIRFVTEKTCKIPFAKFGNKHSGGRNPLRTIPNIQNINGFGISLSLKGWYIFLEKEYTLTELSEKIKSGTSIEELFNGLKPQTAKRCVSVDGNVIDLKSACRKTGVPYWVFIKKAKGLYGDDLQKCFDSMREKVIKSVTLSDEDYEALNEYAKYFDESIEDAIHRLIGTVTY